MDYGKRSIFMLAFVLSFLLFLGSCNNDDDSVAPDDNTENPDGQSEAERYEQQAFDLVNAYRQEKGLPALENSDVIRDECRAHSQDMADGTVEFGHDGFQRRVNNISLSISLSSAGENVAWNKGHSDPAQTAVDGWINSQGHRENMEGDYTHAGMGVSINEEGEVYFTQIFIKAN